MLNPGATFGLARELRSAEGAPLGEVFSFVSGLYFRGKLAYATAFGKAPEGLSPALVISPAEGLRFAHERVTVERLRAWATVPIDEENPRFTEPLVAHAAALDRAFEGSARFVLLGSVASDKYVRPLTRVFGARLLFPTDFVGRGDMSRGSLMLRAARSGTELRYAPIVGARLHGSRPAPRSRVPGPSPAQSVPELVLLIGLPGAGKTTFFRQRFAATHVHVNADSVRGRGKTASGQLELVQRALANGYSVVADNTHVGRGQRAALITEARRAGARVIGYYFDAPPHECVAQNERREQAERVPAVAIFAAARRLVPPSHGEGFDALHVVQNLPDERFEVISEPADH